MPLGPPCNASAPSGSHQALGNESMAYGEIFRADVDKLSQHFHLFDKVYVGSLWPDGMNIGDESSRATAVAEQAKVLREFYTRWGEALGPKLGWYQTVVDTTACKRLFLLGCVLTPMALCCRRGA